MRRVPVNSVVRKLVMFSNVIVDIAFPRLSFVFSQSSCEVSASLTGVGYFLLNYRLSHTLGISSVIKNDKSVYVTQLKYISNFP